MTNRKRSDKGKQKAVEEDVPEQQVVNSNDDDDDHARLLQLLNSRCSNMLGVEDYKYDQEEDGNEDDNDTDDDNDYDEEGSGSVSDDNDGSSNDDTEQIGLKRTGENVAKDGDSMLNRKPAVVYHGFQPDVSSSTLTDIQRKAQKDAKGFMSSSVQKQLTALAENEKTDDKNKRRKTTNVDSDSEEEDMKKLDETLNQVVKTLPQTLSEQTAIAGKTPAKIDAHTPLPLRRAKEAFRLKKAKIFQEERRNGQIIAAKSGPALTKREFRNEKGIEKKRRKNAAGISGAVGKMGGGNLRLSARDIERIKGTAKGERTGKGGYNGLRKYSKRP